MRTGIVFLNIQIAFVVEQTVEHKRCVAVRALMREAVVRGVIVRHEIIELQGKVIEGVAVTFL